MPAYAQLLVILAAMIGFWAIVMRPARNQQKRVERLQSELEVGQEVVLSSGIFGTVRALTERRVELEVAPGTVLTVARQVVVRRVSELDENPASDPGTGTETGRSQAEGPDESGPTKPED